MLGVLLCSVLCLSASADTYSTQYPNIYNSGSPVWLHCQIDGMGEYVIVIDPKTNLQSFGFDGPDRYNLINNTGSTIYGRAYDIDSSTAYNARWTSFYKLQLQTGTSTYGQSAYEDYDITAIYGTTLDLIDYNGTRGNDAYKYDIEDPDRVLIITVVVLIFVLVYQFHFKSRLMRL